jgi:hypothetical protein
VRIDPSDGGVVGVLDEGGQDAGRVKRCGRVVPRRRDLWDHGGLARSGSNSSRVRHGAVLRERTGVAMVRC